MCSHCTGKVEQVLSAVAGVEGVVVDLKGSCAVVTGSADEAALVEAVVDAGFKAALASGAADEAGGARGGAPEGRGGALAAEAPASLEAVAVEISASPLPGSPIPPKAGKDSSAALLSVTSESEDVGAPPHSRSRSCSAGMMVFGARARPLGPPAQ